MAREQGNRESGRDEALLDRRSYLRLAGTAAASVATFGASASAASQSTTESSDTDRLLTENFNDSGWRDNFHWKWNGTDNISVTSERSHSGESCLMVETPEGEHSGYYGRYAPRRDGHDPQNELYTSAWMWFPSDFDPQPSGGKVGPGLDVIKWDEKTRSSAGGWSNEAGPGNNWRARTNLLFEPGDPSDDYLEFSAYTYYMDTAGSYGEHIGSATAPKGEWVFAEMYQKLNTLDSEGNANYDGELKMWINGETAVDRSDMRWTEKVDRGVKATFGHFHGGSPANSSNRLYMDEWRVATTRDALTGGNDDDDDNTTTDPGDGDQQGTVLELVTDDGTETIQYEFTVEGSVERRLNAGDVSAETGNDEITDNGDGTVTVVGAAGNGYGDSYLVDGSITSMDLDESKWTVRYDGEEVAVDDLTLPNKLVIDGNDHPRRVSKYTFTVSGTARKDADPGSINEYDTVSDGEISGRVIGGVDGYRFSGEITGFSLDGPATVRVEDGS